MNPAVPSSSALPTDPARKARRWAITTTAGETTAGHLPAWATVDPSEQDVPTEELATRLADINHHVEFPGQVLRVYSPGNSTAHPKPLEILRSSIDCNPYATAPEPAIPVVNIRVADEYWLTDLGPKDLTAIAEGLRTIANRLDQAVIPTLNAARTDWTTHHAPVAGARP